jgi:adenine deaminase
MFCSDDKHPNELAESHINKLASRAVAKGCDLFRVLRACSLTPASHYEMDLGLLQVGDHADFCIVKDLVDFKVEKTYIKGQLVAREGKSLLESVVVEPVNHFACSPISAKSLEVEDIGKKVKVILVEDGQLITKRRDVKLEGVEGHLQSDLKRDILKMVVVNRYENAPPAIAFVKNFGLKEGAIASCVAHDSHNIIGVGTNDEEITRAINLIISAKGGISLVNGSIQKVLPLPITGIMSGEDGYKVARAYETLDLKAKALGSNLSAPFMTLSFCALLVIPELKLSDKGLFDGSTFSLTSIYVD